MVGQIGGSGADVRAETSCRRNERLDKPEKRVVNKLLKPSVIVSCARNGLDADQSSGRRFGFLRGVCGILQASRLSKVTEEYARRALIP